MKNKATYRMVAIQYLDTYKSAIQSGYKILEPLIERLNSSGIYETVIGRYWDEIILSIMVIWMMTMKQNILP